MKEGVSSVHDTPSSVNLLSVKDFEAIVLFSEIIIVLLQAYLLILLKFRMWFKYGLKAQKLLAQGVWGLLAKLNLSNGILINIYYFQ